MNFFLYINKKLIFLIGIAVTFFFLILVVYEQMNLTKIELEIFNSKLSDADITEPKFTINSETKKILITAKEANFLNNNEILLKKNVKFESNDFSIEAEKVIFNRSKQTAQSDSSSLFRSNNSTISSDGFNIYDKGSKIIFYGKSLIILK